MTFKNIFIAFIMLAMFSFAPTIQAQYIEGPKSSHISKSKVDYGELSQKLGIQINERDSANLNLYSTAADWLGVRYKWGGSSRASGVDCSGFTSVMYHLLYNENIDHSSSTLSKSVPVTINSTANLKPGDMVFFATSKRHSNINHVGIYLKDGFFVHASSARGKVMISTLLEGFYKSAWRKGGRLSN